MIVKFKNTFHREYVCLFLSLLVLFACCSPFLLSCCLRLLAVLLAVLLSSLAFFSCLLACWLAGWLARLLASFLPSFLPSFLRLLVCSLFGRFVHWFVVSFVRFCLSRPFVRWFVVCWPVCLFKLDATSKNNPPDVFPRVCFHYFSSTPLEWVHLFLWYLQCFSCSMYCFGVWNVVIYSGNQI